MKLIYGVGYNDKSGEYTPTKLVNGKNKISQEYEVWRGMLRRCYSDNLPENRNRTYVGCTCSENFKSFQYFAKWANEQAGWGLKGYALDKDILIKGNKYYSEDTCVFVPAQVNALLTKSNFNRGKLPIGVSWHTRDGVYEVYCKTGIGRDYLGRYKDVEQAFKVYKTRKEEVIKEIANKYKDAIDKRAYLALMAYEVDIND